MSLSKKYFLRKKIDFKNNKETKDKLKSGCLVLKYSKNVFDYPRFGIVVSQKISKKAVVRNKIRRRIKAIIEQELSTLVRGYDLIFFVRSSIVNKSFKEIRDDFKSLLAKANLLVRNNGN